MRQQLLPIVLCLLPCFVVSEVSIDISECGKAKDCRQCMGIGPNCSWCFDNDFDDTKEGPGYRCSDKSILINRGCPANRIEDIDSRITNNGSEVMSGMQSEAVQFAPRLQSVKIRPNVAFKINFTFKSISDYPVDLYLLTDLSYTMRDDLETVSSLTYSIVETMRGVTKNLQMGFGAFVDKPVFPFVVPTQEYLQNPCRNAGTDNLQCDPPFLFKHILSLTDNFEEFKEKTKVARPSGNLDSPEGGLDALLQVAHCGEFIKWRANARKIVLFASDGGFHLAGDGRIAGLIRPPPSTCQLTEQPDRFNSSLVYVGWHTADQTDYPSIGEIARVLTDTDVSVIFAVDSKLHGLYTSLASFLPSAAVGILSNSSTNIVELLRDNYNKIVNKAELMISYDSNYLEVQVFTKCSGEDSFSKKKVCNEHPVGGRIEYEIAVKAKSCFVGKQTVTLKMVALDDQAVLEVESACDCPSCASQPRASSFSVTSERCQSRGHLFCGVCTCQPGYSGDFCECSAAAASAGGDEAMLAQCTAPDSKDPCSGRGRCICGKCKCSLARYEGRFCECDRHGCKRASDDNQVCGGPQRGECQCDGTCRCLPGYTGDRCDCMESIKQCLDPNNPGGPKCSDRGVCDCGQCFCNSGYTGHLCNEIQGGESALCTDRAVERCVLCLRDALIAAFDRTELRQAGHAGEISATTTTTTTVGTTADYYQFASTEYAAAARQCDAVCNQTVIDTTRVRLVESSEQKDDSNLCIIYPDDRCRIFFTYRYSDAIYVNRKVDLNIIRKKDCAKTVNLFYIMGGVIGGIVLGGLILLLIYKLVITIDDRRELAKFEKQGKNMRWEMAENPIFESPTTKVTNPTFQDNGF